MNYTDPEKYLEIFKEKQKQILISLDVSGSKELMTEMGESVKHMTNATILAGLHKARYEMREMDRALRIESGEWLRSRKLHRLYGMEIFPKGILPGDPEANN